MKTILVMLVTISVILPTWSVAECQKGCFAYQGLCACEGIPESAPSVVASDEKPPRDKMPSYQREGIKADMPLSLAAQDAKADEEIKKAEAQGKTAAKIPQ